MYTFLRFYYVGCDPPVKVMSNTDDTAVSTMVGRLTKLNIIKVG